MKTKLIVSALAAANLISCSTSWPTHGHGGMAEHYEHTYAAIDSRTHERFFTAISTELEFARHKLDILKLNGAMDCFPATVTLAEIRENRITRELVGGLIHDAQSNLVVQRNELLSLEQRMKIVNETSSCILPVVIETREENNPEALNAKVNDDEQISEIVNLLNSNNQFAWNSTKLTPRYAENIEQACRLMPKGKRYSFTIVGHADVSGDKERNLQIANQRSISVKTLLEKCSPATAKFDSVSKGDTNPLYSGHSPEIDLSNRRVTVDLKIQKDGE